MLIKSNSKNKLELKEKAKTMNILLKVNHRKRQTDRGFDKEATRNEK